MTAYYNEHDEFAADWLRSLIKAGLIADGEVDTRSIVDVRPSDLARFGQCHFFAGIGGWSYALRRAGWADSSPVWTGSCPCQPFSGAGAQRGFADERHLWPVWRELIRQCGPAIVFGEQVASAADWLRLVRGDLEEMGRAVGAMPVQAASAGADHLRDRYWFVADADDAGSQGRRILPERAGERIAGADGMADADRDASITGRRDAGEVRSISETQCEPEYSSALPSGSSDQHSCSDLGHAIGSRTGWDGRTGAGSQTARGREWLADGHRSYASESPSAELDWVLGADGKARRVKPGIRLLAHGVPNRVGLLRGFGNAIDPRPAAAFIEAYVTARRGSQLPSHNSNPEAH